MIKEKTTYNFQEGNYVLNAYVVTEDSNGVNAGTVSEALKNYIAQNNIPAVLSEEVYSYKTGLFKSETAPCIVITHSTEPKKFRKLVIAIKQKGDAQTLLVPRWFENSEIDRLIEKSDKLIKKRDKAEVKSRRDLNYNDNMAGSLANMANAKIKNAQVNKIEKKIDELRGGENAYHSAIRDAIISVCNQMKGNMQ